MSTLEFGKWVELPFNLASRMHVNVTSTLYKHYKSYNKIFFALEKFFYNRLPPELSEESFYFHSEVFNHRC